MRKRKVKKQVKITKMERFLYVAAIFSILVSPISIVFSKATLAKVNFDVELEKKNIEEQQKTNESIKSCIRYKSNEHMSN